MFLATAACRHNALAAFIGGARCAIPPLLRLEMVGRVERRPAEFEGLVRDLDGCAVVSHVRPQPLQGAWLRGRPGRIPVVIKESL